MNTALTPKPTLACKAETHRESLIRAIREFIGPGGCIAFEHGFRPKFNAQMVTDQEVIYRIRIKKRNRVSLDQLTEEQLSILNTDILDYYNYCNSIA